MDNMSDYGNMDILLGEGISNSRERERVRGCYKWPRLWDSEWLINRSNSSQENEIRKF